MEAKTLTLVERLKKQINTNSLLPPPNFSEQLLDDISDSITALEQAQKALEPFAKASDAYGASTIIDRMAVDRAGAVAVSDLRLARTVFNMLKGNDHEG